MLTAADLLLINAVARTRFATAAAADAPGPALDGVVATQHADATAYRRAAALVAALLREKVFTAAPLPTALLVLHCSLQLDGLMLLAPQGVVAGMVTGLAAGDDIEGVARWLEDRAVPSSGGG